MKCCSVSWSKGRSATLMPADDWVKVRPHRMIGGATQTYSKALIEALPDAITVDFFGEHVAFDKLAWRKGQL